MSLSISQTPKKIGILGYGEVGKAIGSFYQSVLVKDIERDDFELACNEGGLDVLHVCLPCKDADSFCAAVIPVINRYCPYGIVIVHSTVPVGTTKRLVKHNSFTVHSPVRGVHPDLILGLKTFVKFVGAESFGASDLASKHLGEIGMYPRIIYGTKTTELMKLLDTTYYGACIAFHAYAEKLCKEEGVQFEDVMEKWNRSYNEGYIVLGKANVVRPVLYPPPEGKIGGHCVIPNAHLLKEQFGDDPIIQSILRHE